MCTGKYFCTILTSHWGHVRWLLVLFWGYILLLKSFQSTELKALKSPMPHNVGQVWAALPDETSIAHVPSSTLSLGRQGIYRSQRSMHRHQPLRLSQIHRKQQRLIDLPNGSAGMFKFRRATDHENTGSNRENMRCPISCICSHLEVRCTHLNLTDVPQSLPRTVEKLSLVWNHIRKLNASSFSGLTHLKIISLSSNRINTIETGTFSHLTKLKRLRLNRNELNVLPADVFKGLINLQRLDLRDNNLTCVPHGLFRSLVDLRYVHLSNNNLHWISGVVFEDQTSLKYLDLRSNPFQCDCYLQPFVQYFLKSKRIHLLERSGATCKTKHDYEPLQSLAGHMLHMTNCRGTYKNAPPACITSLHKGCSVICGCTTDGSANCQNRDLLSVPPDLSDDIIELNLANNHLQSLNETTFQNYPNLRKIILDNNQISSIHPKTFIHLKDLSSLYMSSNKLKMLPAGLFYGLTNLKILYLHRNQISCFQKNCFHGLENLQILHLSENRIQTFSRESFQDFKNLKYLYLVNNPFVCDCRLAWLPRLLMEKEAGGTQWSRCAEPTHLQGHHVRDIGQNLLRCDETTVSHIETVDCETAESQCPRECRCTDMVINQASHGDANVLDLEYYGSTPNGLKVDCSDSGIKELPRELPVNTRELILRGNHIVRIPTLSVLSKLRQLETLILDGNKIEHIEPSAFVNNKRLRKLILSNNSLTRLDHTVLEGLKDLEVLLLQQNQITCLNNLTFVHTPALKVIMLNSNKIRCITKGVFENLQLESISISSNLLMCDCHLSWLPDWLRDNADQVLTGPQPPICTEPEDLAGTPVASLARNHLNCPKSETTCSNTVKTRRSTETTLGRSHCSAAAFCCLDPDVSSNKCPDHCTCESDGVYCSDQKLTEIPPHIPTNTTQLYLERNLIKTIQPDRLAHLTKLHTLVISYNLIRELTENVFQSLVSLKTLVISHNNIQCIHLNAFKGLHALRVLILQGNNVSTIPYGAFKDLRHLNNIALGQNPLHCDCNGKWLNSFFRQHFLDNGVALCHSPNNMRYKSLYHSKPSDFVCPWNQRRSHDIIQHNGSNVREHQLLQRDLTNALLIDDHHRSRDPGLTRLNDGLWKEQINGLILRKPESAEERESMLIAAKCMPCLRGPCANGGHCAAIGQLDYKCTCKPPYHGPQCEQIDSSCAASPCKNGGVCELLTYSGVHKCICPRDFRGPTCGERIDTCTQNLCQNGGVCENLGSDFRCHCTPQYHGKTCQNELIYCNDVNPCMNEGTCVKLPENTYRCDCARGWFGKNCEINQDDCTYNRCENGATCIDGINEYICKCRPGYAGMYCERYTWNSENQVTRLDRQISLLQRAYGVTSAHVRHSPIKTRSLSVPPLNNPCAYHQCQNGATCMEGQDSDYICRCQPGFSGQYCENLYSINLPSSHSYIAIVPPSRGAMVPQGTIAMSIVTRTVSGIVLYYAEMVQSGNEEAPEQYLLVDLTRGYLRTIFALDHFRVMERISQTRVNDGLLHRLEVKIEGAHMTFNLDDIPQPEIHTSIKHYTVPNESVNTSITSRKVEHLALTNPLYFGGAPADRLETAARILHENHTVGMTGCIYNIQVNNRPVDIARLFGAPVHKMTGSEEHQLGQHSPETKRYGTAIGILPGCESPLKVRSSNTEYEHATQKASTRTAWEPRGSHDDNGHYKINNPCHDKPCLANGTCKPVIIKEAYMCQCVSGQTGSHCTSEKHCQKQLQWSYVRDPVTDCISSLKLSVGRCSGSCDFYMNEKISAADDNARRLWLRHLPKFDERHSHISHCCQPSKMRHRSVRFQCPDGTFYQRTVKLIRRCTCTQCPN